MRKTPLSETELIGALIGADPERRRLALRSLFDDPGLRQSTINHVRRHGGSRQDAEDVFQEAVIIFDRKLRLGAFRGEGTAEAFFMGIVRWYWFDEQQRAVKTTLALQKSIAELPPQGDPELEYLLAERREQLGQLLDQLSEKCRNLLKMYQLSYSMEEIAGLMGFANSGVAKKEASLCRKRLRAVFNKNPTYFDR
jgi:RNA polymerase sigma factor (sigma-70 family)